MQTKPKRKPYKRQEDRLLKRLSQSERRYQESLRYRIQHDVLDFLYV